MEPEKKIMFVLTKLQSLTLVNGYLAWHISFLVDFSEKQEITDFKTGRRIISSVLILDFYSYYCK